MTRWVKERRKRRKLDRPHWLGHLRFETAYDAARYEQLARMMKRGEIGLLTVRPRFPFYHGSQRLWDYVPSFSYHRLDARGAPIGLVVEDVREKHVIRDPSQDPKLIAFEAGTNRRVQLIPRAGLQLSKDRRAAYARREKAKRDIRGHEKTS